jgi:oxygen-dependent protoporphyrinogen oxidase
MESLPRALMAANREQVRVSEPVRAIARDRGWTVTTDRGQVLADRIALTVPAPAAAQLLSSVDESSAAAIGGLRYNRLAVVHLHANETIEGLGFQVSFAEDMVTRGVTFNASLFGRSGVYTAYLGGAKSPHLPNQTVEEIGTIAVREFRQVTGLDAAVLSVAWEAMPAWDHTWSRISNLALPAGLTVAANWESRPGIPGRLAQASRVAQEIASSYPPS